MATPEAKVKAGIKAWLKKRGIWFCMPIGTGFGTAGVPDFVCCWKGRFLAIEAKAPGKRSNTTELQDHQIALIHKAGGAAIVVDDPAQLDVLARELSTSPPFPTGGVMGGGLTICDMHDDESY